MLPFFREDEILKPSHLVKDKTAMPFSVIITWQRNILVALDSKYGLKQVSTFHCGINVPVYEFKASKQRLGAVLLPIGAPVSAGFIEEYIVRGVMRFVCIGYAGLLSPDALSKLIVPTRAYRDEGTSWHYAPHESPWIDIVSSKQLDAVLTDMGVPHICGPVWTTDAFYRETPSAVKMMKEQKCLCVDMECAANMAVAQYRGVQCYQMMFNADRLDREAWEVGNLKKMGKDIMEKYATIAVNVALS